MRYIAESATSTTTEIAISKLDNEENNTKHENEIDSINETMKQENSPFFKTRETQQDLLESIIGPLNLGE
jgi:hypothetical protein